MTKYNFKKVIKNKPSFDGDTEYLTVSGYDENDENIIINYTINKIELTTVEPTLEERVFNLEMENKQLETLLNTTMLATDEMYMLIEPLLADMLSETTISKIADMYVAMVQRGITTNDNVPLRYREEVKNKLK